MFLVISVSASTAVNLEILASSVDLTSSDGTVHVTMLPNPSHLEIGHAVGVGKARARARSLNLGDYAKPVCCLSKS